jgi:alpha-N-arabinofuranosidase
MPTRFTLALICLLSHTLLAQTTENRIVVDVAAGKHTISRHIYGHFAEHLGRCIYDGIWVGENSPIPNYRGFRSDVVAALQEIAVPNIRWPGGCFADEYHWLNGIGPRANRPLTINSTWGGVIEDNSFGTHEFLEFCELIGAEPYITINVGSGTVKEASDWVEYVNSDSNTPMANLRRQNGRTQPWRVRYWGIGNESWGCGGIMTADYYASELARYSWFLKTYGGTELYKIASGGLPEDFHWTETIMRKWRNSDGWLQSFLSGYSLHFYTVVDWSNKGSATNFTEKEWFAILKKTLEMETLITKHVAIMDQYDPAQKIGLIVDEWGTWYDVEPGANPAFLYQQNTLRDALVAGINLNIFNNHCDRVKMANIAQLVNVLQSVLLTKHDQLVRTPTFYVFKMYRVHQDATLLPISLTCKDYQQDQAKLPTINASASRDQQGLIHLTLCNLHPEAQQTVSCEFQGAGQIGATRGEIITAARINAFNDFGKPEEVTLRNFTHFKAQKNTVTIDLPAKAVVMLELTAK